jgi:integrase
MARRNEAAPQMRLHRKSGHARVRIGGREHWLGPWGSQEAKERYRRLVAEWLGNSEETSQVGPLGVTVVCAIEKYSSHVDVYYRRGDGSQTHEASNLRDAIRPLRLLYGLEPLAEFTADKLRVVRSGLVARNLARTTINARINRIRRFFRWCASHRLCPPSVVHELELVEPLMPGRSQAKESPRVKAVDAAVVEATLPHMSRPVAAMVRLQLLSGMRAGEVATLRGRDITLHDDVYVYRPSQHKTEHAGRERVVFLGPRAMEIVDTFAKSDPDAYLFSPRDVVTDVRDWRLGGRSAVSVRDFYDRRGYRQAVVRACDRAFPHPTLSAIDPRKLTPAQKAELSAWRKAHRWSPLQIRHAAATEIRQRYGLEASQVVLGHAKADVTQLYAERDQELARRVMREVG